MVPTTIDTPFFVETFLQFSAALIFELWKMIVIWDSLRCHIHRLCVCFWCKWLFLSDLEVDFVSEADLVLLLTFLYSYAIAVLTNNEGTLFA